MLYYPTTHVIGSAPISENDKAIQEEIIKLRETKKKRKWKRRLEERNRSEKLRRRK